MSETDRPQCPFCDGTDTGLLAPFGSQLSVSTYWCNRCHTAFEKLKWTTSHPDDPILFTTERTENTE